MDQNLTNYDFFESVANVDIPLRNTINVGERSNKCNRCEYASSVKGNLKFILKRTLEERRINVSDVTMHALKQAH